MLVVPREEQCTARRYLVRDYILLNRNKQPLHQLTIDPALDVRSRRHLPRQELAKYNIRAELQW